MHSVAFSPDGTFIVSGSYDMTVRIWDAMSGTPIGEPLSGHSDWVLSVAISPDGAHVISSSFDKTARIWHVMSGVPISEPIQGHPSLLRSVAISPDGARFVSGSYDNTIQIWDAMSGAPISVGRCEGTLPRSARLHIPPMELASFRALRQHSSSVGCHVRYSN